VGNTKLSVDDSIYAPGFRIGVDVGGTFTDLVVGDRKGRIKVHKVSTVPDDPAVGVLNAVQQAADTAGMNLRDFLERCDLFIHGTTVATNTLLEKKGAKVGCLVTDGFRDSLEIRRGYREDPWDHRSAFPPPLSPRHLRIPIRERTESDGTCTTALNRQDLENAAKELHRQNVGAVAVAFYNSYANANNERQAAKYLRECGFPWVAASSEISPIVGEYERTSTAVLNAYIAPRTVSYLLALDEKLRGNGLRRKLLLIQSNGGATAVDQIASRPVSLLLSGPAAGVGSMKYYGDALGSRNLISMEIGGTSCDVILMDEGTVSFTDLLSIDKYEAAIPSVEVHTIGAGGGTIAGIDEAGMIYVGPQGAGARPGPACYLRGGDKPTVTDAQLVLGRLAEETYADGTFEINEDAAREAIRKHVADRMGVSIEEAAAGIIRLTDQKLLQAVQKLTVERGLDPARFTLVPGGGAGALHGATIARRLGCKRVYVPRIAGAFCAFGMLHSDVRHDYLRVHYSSLASTSASALDGIFSDLKAQALEELTREGFDPAEVVIQRMVDLRYVGQQWDISAEFPAGEQGLQAVQKRFEEQHQRLFGHIQADGTIEIVKLRVTGIGRVSAISSLKHSRPPREPEVRSRRQVWVDEKLGWVQVPIYHGQSLMSGDWFKGPAVIDEQTTTILVGNNDLCRVDDSSNYLIELAEGA
jgi:N-methylhydantoinase A